MSSIASPIPIVIGIFLIAHGLIHASLSTIPLKDAPGPRTPFFPGWWRPNTDPAWPASRLLRNPGLVRSAGWILWAAATLLFAAAGLGLLGVPGLRETWIGLATGGSIVSLVLIALYWHPWYIAGPIIDLAILAAIALRWPDVLFRV